MRYVELCIKEALRLYPLASLYADARAALTTSRASALCSVQARTCMKSTVVGKERQLTIPEGLIVLVDSWSIQRDKSVWGSDADEFRPERRVNLASWRWLT